MSKHLLDEYLDQKVDSYFTPERLGKIGERRTARKLKNFQFFNGYKAKTLRNVYIPKGNGETSEIDVLFLTTKGIFVIESKNYSGWIFGDEKSVYWTAMLSKYAKNRFYNPIRQNQTHMIWLKEYLGEDLPMFSLIVFSERCELKKITVESANIKVIKRNHLKEILNEIWNETPDVCNEEQVDRIYKKLDSLTDVDQAVKAAHIESINQRYKSKKESDNKAKKQAESTEFKQKSNDFENPMSQQGDGVAYTCSEHHSDSATVNSVETSEQNLQCPRCGGKLIVRKATKGKHAGQEFYGCSNFPKCRFIQEL